MWMGGSIKRLLAAGGGAVLDSWHINIKNPARENLEMTSPLNAAFRQTLCLLFLLLALPLSAWAVDTDGDGVDDSADAFPNHIEASVDTDGDGMPDSINMVEAPLFETFESSLVGWTLTGSATRSTWKKYAGVYGGGVSTVAGSGTLSKSVNVGTVFFYTSAPSVAAIKPFKVDGIVQPVTCNFAKTSESSTYKGSWYGCLASVPAGTHTLLWSVSSDMPMLNRANTYAVDNISVSILQEDPDDDNDGLPDVMDPLPLQAKFNRDANYKGSQVRDGSSVE
jgi:hypothetical protein